MPLLYSFYGDDFTGSTDVLEQLATHGIPAVLFLAPPTFAQIAAFPGIRAIGVAGDSRSRSPEWMSENLPAIFRSIQSLGAPVVHYKTCSTFDSSPAHGSIGRAVEIGLDVFKPRFIPIVVGAPYLRRYVAFGNLFAADPDGNIVRIDRHPMAHHPVTPMREADLRVHLAAQTRTKIGLVDLVALNSGNASTELESLIASGSRAILFDIVGKHTQSGVGALLWNEAQTQSALRQSLFAIGSSGLTAALISQWHARGQLSELPALQPFASARPLLVVSGSCSVATQRQIEHALAHGFHGIALDPATLTSENEAARNPAREAALEAARVSLASGRDTILYTALGPIGTAADSARKPGEELGAVLGSLVRELMLSSATSEHPIRRLIFCGGDTSSHAARQLGIHALTWAANLQPGAPLCRAHAEEPALDGIELVLKGGQVGTHDFFSLVRDGGLRHD